MRANGIIMHITSLPSKYGVGTLGEEAFSFVDFLKASGVSYWQILPIGPTGYGDSPYQSFSAFAGNPYFIDLDLLVSDGLLTEDELEGASPDCPDNFVDFGFLYNTRLDLLKLAAERVTKDEDYERFLLESSFWLDDYALYTAIKAFFNGEPLSVWPLEYRLRDEKTIAEAKERFAYEIEITKSIQYIFFKQWYSLKSYANALGVKIIGDIPIYVSPDSADLYSLPHYFVADDRLRLTNVAGCPPDAFSETGQLWGNPLYNWKEMERDGFDWWCKRISHSQKLFDLVRIDHFRGFDSYYAIPYGRKDATVGRWRKGPGMKLFKAIREKIGDLNIIAEDLGTITPSVRRLLKASGFPGMKVLQFAFDDSPDNEYLPHNHIKNCVVYTGTHDNDTVKGWIDSLDEEYLEFLRAYLRLSSEEGEVWGIIKAALASPADLAILPMQDYLNAGSEARMNTPSTLGGNWTWRITKDCLNPWLSNLIYKNNKLYRRIPLEEASESSVSDT